MIGNLPPARATTIDEVVAEMEAIARPLRRSDGLGCFTRLYLAVTESVRAAVSGSTFADPALLGDLDIRFANLFFAAADAAASDPQQLPRAWAPLFEARARPGIAPLQFALAGMNAHINRDLPVALVGWCAHAGLDLGGHTPEHADFERVNRLLAAVEAHVKAQYLSGWLNELDRLIHRVHRIDDVVAMWDVAHARDAAWTNGQALWALRDDEELARQYLNTLDRTVGFAGRGLLIPADSWLGKLRRAVSIR